MIGWVHRTENSEENWWVGELKDITRVPLLIRHIFIVKLLMKPFLKPLFMKSGFDVTDSTARSLVNVNVTLDYKQQDATVLEKTTQRQEDNKRRINAVLLI